MTKQHRQSRHGLVRRPRSRKNRKPASRADRATLFFELLEPRTLLAGGWMMDFLPGSLGSSSLATVAVPPDAEIASTAAEFANLGRSAAHSAMGMNMSDASGTNATNQHMMTGRHMMAGDHDDCCRVYAGAPVTSEAAIETTGMAPAADMLGDHGDCCRPLPAPMASEAPMGAAPMMPANTVAPNDSQPLVPLTPSNSHFGRAALAPPMAIAPNEPLDGHMSSLTNRQADVSGFLAASLEARNEDYQAIVEEDFFGTDRDASARLVDVEDETVDFAAAVDSLLADSPFTPIP